MTTEISLDYTYTIEEFEALPEDGNYYELIEGKLVMVPSAGDEHGRIGDRLVKVIHLLDPEDTLGRVWQTTRFKISPSFSSAPGVAFVVVERIPPKSKGAVAVVPDLVVEIHSPSDLDSRAGVEATQRKIRLYQDNGVRLLWAINPSNLSVEVYHLGSTFPVILGIKEELDGEEILPGFKLKISKLFE
ncbi:MAG: Uma2 family endonuclease [Chloroflexi bacterium]|nr:Uma2 family endonuclease [Chloroflexota bacterium]